MKGSVRSTVLFRTAIAAVVPALVITYLHTISRLPGLSAFDVDHYYERASAYASYLSVTFLLLTPAVLLLGALMVSFKPVTDGVHRMAAHWKLLPDFWFQYVLPLFFFLACAWTAHSVIGGVPRVFDAFNYWFQAKNFSVGQWYAPVPPVPEAFKFPFIIMREGRWYGSVYPGYPLLLAPGIKWNVDWLVNPAIGALSLSCIYLAVREVVNKPMARVAVVLGVFSPFFRMMNAIFMAHAPVILWVSLAVYSLWRWSKMKDETPRWIPLLAGVSLGWIYITRPQAGAVTMPFVLIAAAFRIRRLRRRHIIPFLIPLMIAVVFLGYYNHQLTGDYRINPRYYVDPGRRLGFGEDIGEPLEGGERSGHNWHRGLNNVITLWHLWNAEMYGWGAYGLIGWPALFILIVLIKRRNDAAAWVFSLSILLNFFLYIFYFTPSPNFGPRYISESIPATLIVTAMGLQELYKSIARHAEQRAALAFVILVTCLLAVVSLAVVVPLQTIHYGILPKARHRDAVPTAAPDALILIPREYMTMNIMTWNSPNLDGNIFVPLGDGNRLPALKKAFPERSFYRLSESSNPAQGYELVPMDILDEVRGQTQ